MIIKGFFQGYFTSLNDFLNSVGQRSLNGAHIRYFQVRINAFITNGVCASK